MDRLLHKLETIAFNWFQRLFSNPNYGTNRDPRWGSVRDKKLILVPCCEWCGTTIDLEVHHDYPVSWPNGRAKELDMDNLTVLCGPGGNNCHLIIGHLGDTKSRNPTIKLNCFIMQQRRSNRPYPTYEKDK